MGKIPVGSSSDRSDSSTINQLTYGPEQDYLSDMLFREMFGSGYQGDGSYPGPTPGPPPGPPMAPGQPPTFPGAPTNPYGPGPIPDRGRRPPPQIQPAPDFGGPPGGDFIPVFPGPPPAGPAYPSPTWPGQPTVAQSLSGQIGAPTMDPQQAISYLNGLVDQARAQGGATAYLPHYSTSNVSQNGIQSFGAHEFQGNRQIYAAQQIVDAALRGQPVSQQTAANLFSSAGVDPNQYLPALQQSGFIGGQAGPSVPPPYTPPTPTVPQQYTPPTPLPSGGALAPITQEQFMSTQPGGASQPTGGLSTFGATPVASPLDPLRQTQTLGPRGEPGVQTTSAAVDAPIYPTPPPPGSPPGTPIVGPIPRGRNPIDNPLPPGQNPPNPPTVGGYSGPLQPWQTGPAFNPTMPPPYDPNHPPYPEFSGDPNAPRLYPPTNPRMPVTPVGPQYPGGPPGQHPPPIVVQPRTPIAPPGPPVGPPGPPGGGPPGSTNLYAGGASGARQLTGQGVYDQLARMLRDPGYDAATRSAMTIEGQNAARAGFAGAGGQIMRHAATTGNSAGVTAGLAELGRAQAGAFGQQARQNQIDQFKEGQRQREWATQGLGALYGGESSFLSNLFGQAGNIQGRLRQSKSQTRTRIDTPLISL